MSDATLLLRVEDGFSGASKTLKFGSSDNCLVVFQQVGDNERLPLVLGFTVYSPQAVSRFFPEAEDPASSFQLMSCGTVLDLVKPLNYYKLKNKDKVG